MQKCELLGGCAFFNDKMPIDSGIGALYKRRYCEGEEHEKCARYRVAKALGRDKVPLDLYPNMSERVDKIIEEKKRNI